VIDEGGSAVCESAGVRTWGSLSEVPRDLDRTVVTIGNFDGVHLGHQHVLRRGREAVERTGADLLVVVTFDPHPMAVLRPEHAPSTLSPVPARVDLLARAGADAVLVLPFDREVAAWTPEEFVRRVLVDGLRAAAVVVGANFRFGSKAAGDVSTLREVGGGLGRGLDFETEGVDLDGGPQVWSSTYVRQCLAAGDVEGAAEALGRPFAVRGAVLRGDQRGRELGYPTANVPAAPGLAVPEDGVYAGWLRRLDPGDPGDLLPAAVSVGSNPTFAGERERRIEAYVLDRDDLALYDAQVEVSFVARLRGMARFADADELVAQMAGDVADARRALARG